MSDGKPQDARLLIIPYWHSKTLSKADELKVIEAFADVLTKEDHRIRFFHMMSRERIKSASRIAPLIYAKDLLDAWAAVIRRQKSAEKKMDALSDDDKKTMAYAFMRVEHLRRLGKDDDAIKYLLDLPNNATDRINPDAWWDEIRIISRHKNEAGDFKTAYALAASHKGGSAKTKVDAAFHAGWYALRGLKDEERAAVHFRDILTVATGKISKARGYYWLGRALGKGEKAQKAYESAARFGTTYYGQLAAHALDRDLALEGIPVVSSQQKENVLMPSEALKRLHRIGRDDVARQIYLAFGRDLEIPSQLRVFSELASKNADHYAALKIAKAADWRGINIGTLTHPLGAISDGTGLEPKSHALAYAVARQESEFNIAARSKANALGLLQLLPGTAREMARQEKLPYEPRRLTRDANYNARLGSAYLQQQLGRFDGSYILTFAAYNAGPSRAKEWVKRFGDPRGKSLDEVIDWVEAIPFPETRSYVQRILENYQVYKLQLGQRASLQNDLRFGTSSRTQ